MYKYNNIRNLQNVNINTRTVCGRLFRDILNNAVVRERWRQDWRIKFRRYFRHFPYLDSFQTSPDSTRTWTMSIGTMCS